MANIFEDIDKEKEQLPELKTITDSVVGKYPLNIFQKIAIFIFLLGLALGFLIGNLMPSCSELNILTGACLRSEFNLSITLVIWGVSFIITLFIYMIGHIIAILSSIDEKLNK